MITTENLANEFSLVEKKRGAISAGPGLTPTDEVDFRLAFRNDWLEKHGGVNQLMVIQVEGDSMTPELRENDVVFNQQEHPGSKSRGWHLCHQVE